MAKTSLTRLDQFSTVGSIKIKRMPPVPDQGHRGREAQNGDDAGAQRGGESQEQEGGGGKADSGSDHIQKVRALCLSFLVWVFVVWDRMAVWTSGCVDVVGARPKHG
jgi:hypothetical protein